MRSSGGRDDWLLFIQIERLNFFEKSSSIGQSLSYPLFQDSGMKRYSYRYRRPHLFPVPYSVRKDRRERGLRILRALRATIAMETAPEPFARQREFEFVLSNRT